MTSPLVNEGMSAAMLSMGMAPGGGAYSRFMQKGELQAIEDSGGYLRGGAKGKTWFTKNKYRTHERAMKDLGLDDPPDVRVDFKIVNNPNIEKTPPKPSRLNPSYIPKGSGFVTTDPVKVKIIRKIWLKKKK